MSNDVNRFSASHANASDFKGDGLRDFFRYRDLGIGKATGGRVGAHVIRATRPCTDGTGRHRHALTFQMFYVLKGWVRFYYEGEGEMTLGEGACVNQPPGIVHELLECSDDCEILEITLPAEFDTADVARESAETATA